MKFFEKLNKTVSDAGEKTIELTKGKMGTSRIKYLINEEQKNIESLYYQVGKTYVSIYKNEPEDVFVKMIEEIKSAEIRIEEYKKKIQDIRGVIKCEKCGAELEKSTQFCSCCGEKINIIQISNPVKNGNCKKCGTKVDDNMKFCVVCGEPIEWKEIESQKAENEINNPEKKYCTNCGIEIHSDFIFCVECGTKLN